MKVLVTGAAGFIGFHLAQRLLELNIEVVGLDSINLYYDVELKHSRLNELGICRDELVYGHKVKSSAFKNFSFIKLDLCSKEDILNLFQKEHFEVVIHLAAQAGVRYSIENPDAYIKSNVEGFINIIEPCRVDRVKHFIYASSSSVYGNNKKSPFSVNDNVDNPVSIYAATKKSNELMAHVYSHLFKIPTTGLRFFTVYGPWGRPDMAPSLFADAIINKKPIKVFNNGNMERDFTYIDDIVDGLIGVIEKPPQNKECPYALHNIGSSNPIKLMRFIGLLEKYLKINAVKEFMPMQLGDVQKTYADIGSLSKMTGYRPKVVLENGVKCFIDWYIDYYLTEERTKQERSSVHLFD